jgi:hypothetical protein
VVVSLARPGRRAYYDACARWFNSLTAEDQDAVKTIIDVLASAHKHLAEDMAASLPPAPRFPSELG